MARNWKEELEQALERRDFLLKNLESHKDFTVPFLKDTVKELVKLESNITDLTTLVEMDNLKLEIISLKAQLNEATIDSFQNLNR